jgi:hypothetical protein
MGRAFRIVKRTTHLTVEVTERAQVIKAVPAGSSAETNRRDSSAKPAPKKNAASKATESKRGRASQPAAAG